MSKTIFQEIYEKALPYYLKGRPYDVDHIKWIMDQAEEVAREEKLDPLVFVPLAILHDVGYANVDKKNVSREEIRKLHMEEGAKIAKEILDGLSISVLSEEQKKLIVYYVSVHDSWALGNSKEFVKDKYLGLFNDLDFIWMVTPEGFEGVRKLLRKTKKEMLDYIKNDEKHKLRPMSESTSKIYNDYLRKLEGKVEG